MKKKKLVVLSILLCAFIMICGCQKAAKKPQVENNADTQIQQTTDSDKRVMASRYSNVAMTVDGVQKATVVVSAAADSVPGGPTGETTTITNNQATDIAGGKLVVMVGLTLNPTAMKDEAKVKAIKEEVRSKIMANDQNVNEVLVTSDPNLTKKLQDVASGVIQGKPIQSYAQDVEELDKTIRGR